MFIWLKSQEKSGKFEKRRQDISKYVTGNSDTFIYSSFENNFYLQPEI